MQSVLVRTELCKLAGNGTRLATMQRIRHGSVHGLINVFGGVALVITVLQAPMFWWVCTHHLLLHGVYHGGLAFDGVGQPTLVLTCKGHLRPVCEVSCCAENVANSLVAATASW